MDGDITVRGNHSSVDTSVSDAWDSLSSLDGALTGHYETTKGRWTILADLFYMKLSENVTDSSGNTATFKPSQTLAELGTTYLINKKHRDAVRYGATEVLAGFRYNKVDMEITDTLGNSVSGDKDWVDPFIGMRYQQRITDRWLWGVRGDIGGFGIGSASDFAWNLVLTGQYDLSKLWGIALGWRWLDVDYDSGSGAGETKWDVLMNGPFLGFQYRW
jgi:hypothetical protein